MPLYVKDALGEGLELGSCRVHVSKGACMEASMYIIIHSAWGLRRVRSELMVHGQVW